MGAIVASSTDRQVRSGPQHRRADTFGTARASRRRLSRDQSVVTVARRLQSRLDAYLLYMLIALVAIIAAVTARMMPVTDE